MKAKIRLEDVVKKTITGEWGTEIKNDINDIYVIRTADFNNDGTINYENILKRNIKKDKINEKKLEIGDIIVEKSGGTDKNPVGRVVFFNKKDYLCLANNFTQVIRIKENINSKYIFYNLLYLYKQGNTLKMFNKTTGIQNLQIKQFLSQQINLVSFNEQNKIVNELDKVQEIIDLRKKQIEELEDLIKSEFVEMFGDPFDNSKWKIKKLGEVAESIYDGTNIPPKYYQSEGKVLFLRIQNVWRNEFRLDDSVYVTEETNKIYMDTSLKNGDLLITKIGRYYTKESSLGRVAIYLGEDNKANYSNNIMRIRVKDEINSKFLNILLNLEDYQLFIRRESKGGTDKRALSKKVIEDFPIIIPPIEMQNQFIKFVKQIDNQKFILEKSLNEIEELQESLMNKYFGE